MEQKKKILYLKVALTWPIICAVRIGAANLKSSWKLWISTASKAEKSEVKSRKLEIIDYRNVKEPEQLLATLKQDPSSMLWAEGHEKKAVAGKDRCELQPADALIIWTIPPSPDDLRAALKKVQPETVYLFGVTEPIETLESLPGTSGRLY